MHHFREKQLSLRVYLLLLAAAGLLAYACAGPTVWLEYPYEQFLTQAEQQVFAGESRAIGLIGVSPPSINSIILSRYVLHSLRS